VTDYDLFLIDDSVGIVDSSTVDQTVAGQDPFEIMGFGYVGERVVVVRWSGATKALRLDTFRGRLTHSTAGATFGHNAAEKTISVAATNVSTAAGSTFRGGTANPIQTYSSDGPRRMFFNPGGTAITPGNVLFGTNGGQNLQKPDLTAADCVTTTTPGFTTFCGTSAAAPHAAAIAALLKSVPATLPERRCCPPRPGRPTISPPDGTRNAGVGIRWPTPRRASTSPSTSTR
jgi:subtilisin family serine protease